MEFTPKACTATVNPGFSGNLFGLQIYEDKSLTKVEVIKRYPKSKKKRIRKKWEKYRWSYVHVPDDNIYKMQLSLLGGTDCFIGHPATIAKLRTELMKNAAIKVDIEICAGSVDEFHGSPLGIFHPVRKEPEYECRYGYIASSVFTSSVLANIKAD